MKSAFYPFLFPPQSLLGIRVWRSLGNNIRTMIDVLGCAFLLLYLCYLWSLQLGFWCLLITNGLCWHEQAKKSRRSGPNMHSCFMCYIFFLYIYTGSYPTLKFHVY